MERLPMATTGCRNTWNKFTLLRKKAALGDSLKIQNYYEKLTNYFRVLLKIINWRD